MFLYVYSFINSVCVFFGNILTLVGKELVNSLICGLKLTFFKESPQKMILYLLITLKD